MFSSPSADPPLLLNDAPASRRTTFLQGRKAAFVYSVLNIMNAIMGSGILALPAGMSAGRGTGVRQGEEHDPHLR